MACVGAGNNGIFPPWRLNIEERRLGLAGWLAARRKLALTFVSFSAVLFRARTFRFGKTQEEKIERPTAEGRKERRRVRSTCALKLYADCEKIRIENVGSAVELEVIAMNVIVD